MPLSCSPSPCAVKLPAFGACPLSVDRRLTRLWATGYGWGAGTQAASEGGRGTVAGVTAGAKQRGVTRLRREAATARRSSAQRWRDTCCRAEWRPERGNGTKVKGEPAATPLARERGAALPRWRRTVGGKVFRPPPLAAPAACDVRFVTGGTRRARERATCRRHLGLAGTIRTAVTRRQGKRAGRPRSQATLPHTSRETCRAQRGLHH